MPWVGEGELLSLDRLLHRRRNHMLEQSQDASPRFFQKGNTHFYRLEGDALESAIAWAKRSPSVDRVVVEAQLPM